MSKRVTTRCLDSVKILWVSNFDISNLFFSAEYEVVHKPDLFRFTATGRQLEKSGKSPFTAAAAESVTPKRINPCAHWKSSYNDGVSLGLNSPNRTVSKRPGWSEPRQAYSSIRA